MLTNRNDPNYLPEYRFDKITAIEHTKHLNNHIAESDFSFKVNRISSGICLRWSTGAEKNMDRFDILHSRDGVYFSKLTHVAARGNSNFPSNYEWIHTSPAHGANYYRLQQFFKNEEFTYNKAIQINK